MNLSHCWKAGPALALALLFFAAPTVRSEPAPTAEQKRIDQLIKQLGADGFEDREQAQKELEKIGQPALEALRLATKNPELEVSRRAKDLVARLEELLKSSKQLAPKKVHLKLKDVSVVEAVADLSKQSGYPIQIVGDKTKLAAKNITLETGETSFWEAFDQLCLKAGLVEPQSDGKAAPTGLRVVEGTPKPVPTSYAGALRVRLVLDSVKRKAGVAEFMLELTVEPRFRVPKVLSPAKIETATDEQGKPLAALDLPSEKPTLMRAPAALRLGDQKALKELGGTVLFETVMADKVLAIDDVAKSAGKSVKNDEGATLTLNTYTRKENGDITIRVSLSKQIQRMGQLLVIGPETFKEFRPELRDVNGLPFQLFANPGQSISLSNTNLTISQTITYRPQPGSGEPAELSLMSDKRTPLSVPFSFKNFKLP